MLLFLGNRYAPGRSTLTGNETIVCDGGSWIDHSDINAQSPITELHIENLKKTIAER